MKHSVEQVAATVNYIIKIFRAKASIVLSWGLDRKSYLPMEDEDGNYGLSFTVNGFKHKGTVQVLFDDGADTFVVKLIGANGEVLKKVDDVYLDNLVEVIDHEVEHVDNYRERVSQEYGI